MVSGLDHQNAASFQRIASALERLAKCAEADEKRKREVDNQLLGSVMRKIVELTELGRRVEEEQDAQSSTTEHS